MQNKEIIVAYKPEKKNQKNSEDLLTRTDPYNTINIVDDEMINYVPCKKRCELCGRKKQF